MPQRLYARERVRESLEALGHAKAKMDQAYDSLTVTVGPREVEVIRIAGLSPREREVVKLYAKGLNYKQIAAELQISPETVKVHRRHIMRHLNVRDQTKLMRAAILHDIATVAPQTPPAK